MLIIGDIHLQARWAPAILDAIRSYIHDHPDETTVLFLGDYVYHFSYHRKSLLDLFSLFGELYQQGKKVYVLAGNHDWLGQHFVFAEGQYAVQLLQGGEKNQENNSTQTSTTQGELHFVTEPMRINKEGQPILLVPHVLHPDIQLPLPSHTDAWHTTALEHIYKRSLQQLQEQQTHKGHRLSAHVNARTAHAIDAFLKENINARTPVIAHHYYIADTIFPGQKGRFGLKDGALDKQWLEVENVRLISGHIHQPFVHRNYLCTGSVRYTSPLEYNQHKFVRKRDIKQDKRYGKQRAINPYIRTVWKEQDTTHSQSGMHLGGQDTGNTMSSMSAATSVQEESLFTNDGNDSADIADTQEASSTPSLTHNKLEELRQDFYSQARTVLQATTQRNIQLPSDPLPLPLEYTTLHVRASGAMYESLDQYIHPDLQKELSQSKLQQHQSNVESLLDKLQESQHDFAGGRQDRKHILEEYLRHKVPDQYKAYIRELEELELL